MSVLLDIEGYETKGIKIDPNGTEGAHVESSGLFIVLPKKPKRSEILFHDQPKALQLWRRLPMPEELQRIRSMDEWFEKPAEFRSKFRPYVEEEFRRRREGVWFYNNGEPYIYYREALHDASVDEARYRIPIIPFKLSNVRYLSTHGCLRG
jgi:hypothetical protein